MATAEELVVRASMRDELSRPVRALKREIGDLAGHVGTLGSRARRSSPSVDKLAAGVGRLAKSAGRGLALGLRATAAGIVAVTAAAAAGSVKIIGLAMDAAETASAFGTVFKGVSGDVAGYVKDMNQRFGITTAELQRAATTFGVFGKAAGVSKGELGAFTKDLVGAGLDLASFYNADPTEVFTALRSGLAGEAEPLRQFGIFLSDAAMKAEAATMGLTGELNESQKVMVRQRIIMKSLGDAQGDLDRTSGGLANQWKKLKGRLKEGATVLGTALLPAATAAATAINARLGPATDWLADRLPGVVDTLGGAAARARSLWTSFQTGGLGSVITEIDSTTGAGGRLSAAFELAKGILADVRDVITGGLLPGVRDVSGAIDPGWLTPLGAARSALGFLADNATLVRIAVVGLTAALVLNRAVMLGAAAVSGVATAATFIQTASTYGLSYALKAGGTAAKLYAAAQWLMNAAMSANPIGLIVIAIAALVGGIIYAYRNSETFRNILNKLWEGIKVGAEWIGKMFMKFTPLGIIISNFGTLKDLVMDVVGWFKKLKFPKPPAWLSKIPGVGDTATSHARGPGGLDRTLAMHSRLAAPGIKVSNALTGGGGAGRGSGDHQRGRALDLIGPGLGAYKRRLESAGGWAQFHGAGAGRHLHGVYPAGDTRVARSSRTTPSSGATGVVIAEGAVTVIVQGNASDVDRAQLKRAVREAVAEAARDRAERAGR